MDAELFGAPDFDVKSWVNAQVAAASASGNVDEPLSTLAVKLQLMSQAANRGIDDAASRLLTELPQAMADMECVGRDASVLALQVAGVVDKVSQVERSGHQTVAALATLHSIKTRMDECAHTLSEADSLTKVLGQVEPLFMVDDVRTVAARLGSIRKSLAKLGSIEEFQDAKKQLSVFESRLEERVASKLTEGIADKDTAATRTCLEIYDNMGRRDAMVERYVAAATPRLKAVFTALNNDGGSSSTPMGTLVDAGGLDEAVRSEAAWCKEVFAPDGALFVSSLYCEVAKEVARGGAVHSKMFGLGGAGLLRRGDACKKVAVLAHRVAEIIEGESKSEGEGAGVGEKGEGKSSAEGGIYWPVFGATMALVEKCQRDQPEVEGTALKMAIERRRDAALAAHGLQQVVGLMEVATAVTFRELRDAARRSIAVTCGGETLPLVRSLDDAVSAHSEMLRRALSHLMQLSGVDGGGAGGQREGGVGGAQQGVDEGGEGGGRGSNNNNDDELLEGEGGGASTALHTAVQLVRGADELESKLREFDQELCKMVVMSLDALVANEKESERARKNDAEVMCLYIYRDKEKFSQLCKYRSRAKVEGFICMVRGPSVVQAYRTRVEEFLVGAALAPVKAHLNDLHKLPVWGEGKKGAAASQGFLPNFSASPLPYVTLVAEHLFSLPDSLDPSEGDEGGIEEASRQTFLQHWLAKITSAVIDVYTSHIMTIPVLSPSGCLQLATDVSYLASILKTLGAPGTDKLNDVQRLLEAKDQDFAQACVECASLEREGIDKISRKRAAWHA